MLISLMEKGEIEKLNQWTTNELASSKDNTCAL